MKLFTWRLFLLATIPLFLVVWIPVVALEVTVRALLGFARALGWVWRVHRLVLRVFRSYWNNDPEQAKREIIVAAAFEGARDV